MAAVRSHDKKQKPQEKKKAALAYRQVKMKINAGRRDDGIAAATLLAAVLFGCLATSVQCKFIGQKRVISLRCRSCVCIYSDAIHIHRCSSSASRCHYRRRRARAGGGVGVAAAVLLQGVRQRALRLLLRQPVHADVLLGHPGHVQARVPSAHQPSQFRMRM